jgi:calcineurin-like phosphoesterase
MVGDVVGAPGLRILFAQLPSFSRKMNADIVIANGENAQKGFGIGREEIDAMLHSGVTVITSGNHVWERKEAADVLTEENILLRPANYPPGLPGKGIVHVQGRDFEWVVINLQGREDLYNIDCPFRMSSSEERGGNILQLS